MKIKPHPLLTLLTLAPMTASALAPRPVGGGVSAAPDVAAEVQIYRDLLGARLSRPIAEATEDISREGAPSSPLGVLVAREVLGEVQKIAPQTQVFITNDGGLRASLNAGQVTLANVFEIMPFDNQVVRLDVSGAALAQICDAMISKKGEPIAGLTATLNAQTGKASDIRVGGVPLDPAATYHIATSDYLVEAGWLKEPLKGAKVIYTGFLLRDAIAAGLEGHEGPLRRPTQLPLKWSQP